MHAIILAGGLGTRLRAVVPDVPKPMAPIGGRPFLEYLLRQLQHNGFRDVVLSVGYRAETIRDHFGDGAALGMRLRYAVEREPLGTAGALRLATSLAAGGRWLVLNGDTFFGIDFERLLERHVDGRASATLALRRVEDASRYGAVTLAPDGAVTRFVARGPGQGGGLINAGIYVVERLLIDRIPAGRQVSLEHEVLPAMAGEGLQGIEFEAPFVDIGDPADYRRLAADPAAVLADLALGGDRTR